MASILDQLRGGLVVSCQPVPNGPLDHPEMTAAFARAALDGGGIGLRIEGVANLRAVRKVTSAPIIGLMKVDSPDTPIRITPTVADVRALIAEGADIIAFDATDRPRPEPVEALIEAIRRDKAWNEEAARKTYVAILEVIEAPKPKVAEGQIPPEDPVVATYRRRLSSVVLS